MERGKLEILKRNRVTLLNPDESFISEEVDPNNLRGCTLYPNCRLFGRDTIILDGSEVGREGPVTIENCQLGKNVKFKAGYAANSTFLHNVEIGLGAHIREGCLLEEFSKVAHTVGLKHTVLFPFVTLGSLINFCDCLMAGGTDSKNHSEVGSSYIHFNFTPNQDKATPSLIGDVPKGVMLDQPPIFLGGQGGMVGPLRIAYGVVVAAGVVLRKDVLSANTIVLGERSVARQVPFVRGYYPGIKRIFELNVLYVANLIALRTWYLKVRAEIFPKDELALIQHAGKKLDMGIEERIKRLEEVVERLPGSLEIEKSLKGGQGNQYALAIMAKWETIKAKLLDYGHITGDESLLEEFKKGLTCQGQKGYIPLIKGLPSKTKALGTEFLNSVVRGVKEEIFLKTMGWEPANWP